MLKFAEIRHLDGVKGNFEVSDEKEYVGTATLKEPEAEQSIPQLIYSNVQEIVEQQQYVFDSFWNRAIPSEQKIREIEDGVDFGKTEIIQSPKKILELFLNMIKSAKSEILLMLPTINAFLREERIGAIELLKKSAAEHNVNVRIITPSNNDVEKILQNRVSTAVIKEQKENQKKEKGFEVQRSNIQFKEIAMTTVTILVVDKRESLVMEKTDDSKENFIEAIGLSTYSDSEPTVMSYLSIFGALWRQAKLYEELREANEQLQQADCIKTEFINIAAHELRTPIMPIIGYAELLEEEELRHNERKQSVTAIIRNAKRLQRLADAILDVTQIETNTLKINKQQFHLNDLILNVLDDIVINTKEEELKGLVIDDNSSSISNNRRKFLYKASEEEIIIQADRTRLIQVIFNLIDNAIKFTKQEEGERGGGGGTISIVVDKKRKENINNDNNTNEEEKVIVSIKDTGTGIDSEILPRLFTKFASKSYKGTGLGLFISKGIIEAHGGIIWAENNSDGKGATFSFTLPIK